MRPYANTLKGRKSGFTMTELMVSWTLSVLVLAAAHGIVRTAMRQWYGTELFMRVGDRNSLVLERMVYGSQGAGGLREADGARLVSGTNGWTLTYLDADDATNVYVYTRSAGTIIYLPGPLVVCSNVVAAEATTNERNEGVSLRVSIQQTEGQFSWSNDMDTFVQFRNRQE